MQVTLGKMEIASRFFQIVMPQQYLNGVQVGTGFQHVRGEAVTEHVRIYLLFNPRRIRRRGMEDPPIERHQVQLWYDAFQAPTSEEIELFDAPLYQG